ncbi:MAG: hypothetical protein KDB03_02205 [Planctomycetales bacterium]|nr:hypothetical protein [Planctomycetales bacterium]
MYKVTGKVSFNGESVTEGSVTLEDGNTGVADAYPISSEGTYEASVPEGEYRVSVQPPMVTVADTANSEGGDEFKKVDNIPNRYWSSYESGLSVSVQGDTTFDVDMKPGRR